MNSIILGIYIFHQPVKNKQEVYGKLAKISRNHNYITRKTYCITCTIKSISIDLSRQKNTRIPEQIDFVGKLEKYNGAGMFFIRGKQQKTIINFSL